MEMKIACDCGQKYAFDVEPVNGRMPMAVNCPACGADGTPAANDILSQVFPNSPPPLPVAIAVESVAAPAPPPMAAAAPVGGLRINRAAPAPMAVTATTPAIPAALVQRPAPPQPSRSPLERVVREVASGGEGEGEKWKWWYFVLAGICIGGYSIWQAYDQHRTKPLGELFFAVFCILIGIWDFNNKRKKKKGG